MNVGSGWLRKPFGAGPVDLAIDSGTSQSDLLGGGSTSGSGLAACCHGAKIADRGSGWRGSDDLTQTLAHLLGLVPFSRS